MVQWLTLLCVSVWSLHVTPCMHGLPEVFQFPTSVHKHAHLTGQGELVKKELIREELRCCQTLTGVWQHRNHQVREAKYD